MGNIAVDIIITTRNNASILKKNLQSIAQQTFSGYQCYIMDDCSCDDTIAMVRSEFPWAKVIGSTRRNGPSANRNRLIELGENPFIAVLDDDVQLDPEWLKEMIACITVSSKIGIIASQLRFLDRPELVNSAGGMMRYDRLGGDLFENVPAERVNALVPYPLRVVYACSAAMFMRRDVVARAGGFDPVYFYGAEDLDIALRANLCGYLCVYNPRAVGYHAYHTTMGHFPKKTVAYLCWRNLCLTILKNFSYETLVRIMPRFMGFCLAHNGWRTAARVFLWNFFALAHIMYWRGRVHACRAVSDRVVLRLNDALSVFQDRASRSDGSGA